MGIFRRHPEEAELENQKLQQEEFDFDFSVLWADQETGGLMQTLLPWIQVIILIIVLVRVFILK